MSEETTNFGCSPVRRFFCRLHRNVDKMSKCIECIHNQIDSPNSIAATVSVVGDKIESISRDAERIRNATKNTETAVCGIADQSGKIVDHFKKMTETTVRGLTSIQAELEKAKVRTANNPIRIQCSAKDSSGIVLTLRYHSTAHKNWWERNHSDIWSGMFFFLLAVGIVVVGMRIVMRG